MRSSHRVLMAAELARWRHQGLVDDAIASRLAPRYDREGHALAVALKWLGLFAIFQIGLGVLGFIGVMSGSEIVGVALLGLASLGTGAWGRHLAIDPLARHPVSGAALIGMALAGLFGTAVLALLAAGIEPGAGHLGIIAALTALVGALLAYRHALRWPLLLALVLLFHAAGTWHAYAGSGAYFFNIQDPRTMAAVALAFVALGMWHEQVLEPHRRPQWRGFGHLYLVMGLLYLNLSLWLLSLGIGVPGGVQSQWVVLFALTGIAALIVGARTHDARFTGFGIVFLSINLYTRFFEHFWDRLELGSTLVLCGAAAMLVGAFIERTRMTR